MARRPIFRSPARPNLYVCAQCISGARNRIIYVPKRGIGTKYLAKMQIAEENWAKKAEEIKEGKRQSMFSILEERGYINQITGKSKALDNLMTNKRIGAYVGIDPTAPSLHIGHMIPLMSLFWMYMHGFTAVTLLGGATAKVGDPTGRVDDREKVHRTTQAENMTRMHFQLKKIWANVEAIARKKGYIWEHAWRRALQNNNTWLNKLSVMEFLQTLGPAMRMGTMLSRDTVKNKMNSKAGMSLAEFTYPVLQAWDFWMLYQRLKVQLQIGGSDQFGNIVAGVEAVNYIRTTTKDTTLLNRKLNSLDPLMSPVGFTTPLLTSSSGEKLGKSAGNALWLDGEMTSPFDLYGYFLRLPDADVERYLKLLTFCPMKEIESVVAAHMKDPKQRIAQHLLAREFVELIHGPEITRATELQHRTLFSKSPSSPPKTETYDGHLTPEKGELWPNLNTVGDSPTTTTQLPMSLIKEKSIGQIVYAAGLATSRSDGHRLVSSGAIYVGGRSGRKIPEAMYDTAVSWVQCSLWKNEKTAEFLVDDVLIFRKGKTRIRIVKFVSDEEWRESGKFYPGERDIRDPRFAQSPGTPSTDAKPEPKVGKKYPVMDDEDAAELKSWREEAKRGRSTRTTARSRNDYGGDELTFRPRNSLMGNSSRAGELRQQMRGEREKPEMVPWNYQSKKSSERLEKQSAWERGPAMRRDVSDGRRNHNDFGDKPTFAAHRVMGGWKR